MKVPRFKCYLTIALDAIQEFYFGGQAKEILKMISQPYMFLVHVYQEHIYNSWEGGEHIETDFFPFKL